MRWWTPRRRFSLVCGVGLLIGYLVHGAANAYPFTPTVHGWLSSACDSSPRLLCRVVSNEAGWLLPAVFAMLCGIVLVVFALPPAMSWVLRPVRELVPVVDQVGPQNLGYRLRAAGGGDEVAALCRAIDDMMDRIMAGYEGQRRFAANASHELRTPLAVQRTLIEVGMAQPLTDDQFTLLTAQLLRTNERNERLVDGLLVLSETDQGLVVQLPQRLDRIAAAVVAAHRSRAAAAGVELVEHLEPRIVRGEEVLLERLVTNLVQNAIKYNHPRGSVHVTVGATPALIVANTGQVVPQDAVAELFEPFKRLAADRIDHSGGAGLGLAIARSITRAHAGTITATAQDGGGLRVEVRLPE